MARNLEGAARGFPPVRLTVALAVLLLAGPAAAAGERVDIVALRVPGLVIADLPFTANVTLVNRLDEPVTTVVYAALYAAEGEGPCGAQTGKRWRGVVSFAPAYAEVALAPGETRPYPAEGAKWTWRIDAEAVPEDAAYEVCVFAGEQGAAAPPGGLAYDDLWSTRVHVRPWNEAPRADFAWSPPTANVTTPFTFRAHAEDDDGDPVTFQWDFGDRTAKGQATAEGQEATHRFFPEGDYRVMLAASDGFVTTRVAKTVHVLAEDVPTPPAPAGEEPDAEAPAAGALVLMLLVAVVALTADARRRR